MKTRPKVILCAGLFLWFGTSAVISYDNRLSFNEKWQVEAVKTATDIEKLFEDYAELLDNLRSLLEADNNIGGERLENFLDNWRISHHELENKRIINFFGFYPFNRQLDKEFFVTLPHTSGVTAEFIYSPLNIPKNSSSSFATSSKLPFLSVENYDPATSVIAAGTASRQSGDGIVFISFNKIQLEYIAKEITAKQAHKLSISVIWEGLRNTPFVLEVYRHKIAFGDDTIALSFEPVVPFHYIGPQNYSGIVSFIAGFAIWLLMLAYLKAVRRHTEIAEKAKLRAEAKLIEQGRFFENFLENLPGILFVKNAQDNYRYYMFNKEAEDFFGFTRAEGIGKFDRDLFNEEQADFFHAMDVATMAQGKVVDIPCEILTVKGKDTFLHTRKVPIYDNDGKPQFLVGLSQDITQRKKNEMELAEYRQNLEEMVEERTQKLKLAMDKAEEASRLKSEFLATMSHEIRSPMSGVLGMTELLLDTPLSSEQQNLCRTILSSGEVLLNIIEDILDFSKIEANKMAIDPIAVNMLDLVDDVCMLYSSHARDKALEIAVRYVPGSEENVYADAIRIRQVLGNLVNNAIKFTQKGHIILTVDEIKAPDIPENHTRLRFTVEDTGIGIEAKDIDRIFEKFSQANSSTTRHYGGTGLGLSISRRLVEMMGGTMTVESVPNKGSTFSFMLTLPRNSEEIVESPKPPILKNLRVLAVDDLAVIRTIMQEELSAAGMICDTASNGVEALDRMVECQKRGLSYDIVVIDYLMPGMNGEMLARAINDEPDYRDMCLIMLTAAGNSVLGNDFSEKGFSAYIAKPIKSHTLIDTLALVWKKFSNGERGTMIRIDSALAEETKEIYTGLEGCKILLVEDSRLNQAFAEEVLAQLNCDVTTVSNGQEAINIIEQPWDLVLMDCQMPVMDGFEAARRIRVLKEEGRVRSDLPIIALTANAMKGDRQRCIEAGMDDYISKPVRKKDLKEKTQFWVHRRSADKSEASLEETEEIVQESGEILNETLLSEARTLLRGKFEYLIDCYIDDVKSYIAEIQDAAALKNIEGLIRPAHTIKSTSKRVGALKLSHLAQRIELAAKDAHANSSQSIWASETMEDIRLIGEIFEETIRLLKS